MSNKSVLSARELECLGHVLLSAKDLSGFQVDFVKMGELAGVAPKSAGNMWGIIKKKLLTATASNAEDSPSTPGSASKTKAVPKKRGAAKGKATAVAGAEAEGDNGVAADDEQTPTNTPKKKAGAKRKIKAEGSDKEDEDCAALDEDAITDETPAKKKRVYNRKPKDPNAATPKPRAKKGAKAASTNPVNDDDAPNSQLFGDVNEEDEDDHQSMFGDGNIKVEGPDELTEYEQYQAQKVLDAQTFGFGGAYA